MSRDLQERFASPRSCLFLKYFGGPANLGSLLVAFLDILRSAISILVAAGYSINPPVAAPGWPRRPFAGLLRFCPPLGLQPRWPPLAYPWNQPCPECHNNRGGGEADLNAILDTQSRARRGATAIVSSRSIRGRDADILSRGQMHRAEVLYQDPVRLVVAAGRVRGCGAVLSGGDPPARAVPEQQIAFWTRASDQLVQNLRISLENVGTHCCQKVLSPRVVP